MFRKLRTDMAQYRILPDTLKDYIINFWGGFASVKDA